VAFDVAAAAPLEGSADGLGDGEGDGEGLGDGAASGSPDWSTDCDPVSAGSERHKAKSIKAAAAPIVILARMLCVPRGPKAVLETLLENNAPASALPGCSRITTTNTTHARINKP
jgi:hypothetical protein